MIFNILASNPISKAIFGIGLYSSGPEGSFDTNIYVLIEDFWIDTFQDPVGHFGAP